MQTYQARVIDERNELNAKIVKLDAFIAGEAFAFISEDERKLLKAQLVCMRSYAHALEQRMQLWANEP